MSTNTGLHFSYGNLQWFIIGIFTVAYMKQKLVCLIVACFMISTVTLNVSADKSDDIPTNVAGTGDHASLVAALTHADLVTTLQGDGPFTVFAPTDQAFTDAGIDLSTFDTDEENQTLVDILTYHVVSGSVMSSALTDGMEADAVNGDKLTFSVSTTEVKVNDAVVTLADVESSNGVIHVIDKVLMPPADLQDIPTIAQGTGVHASLVAALVKADLVTTLQSDGPFTVFAPTDQAFTDAGIDLSTFETTEDITALADLLTYHVVSGTVLSTDLTDGMTTAALNMDDLTFTVNSDGVKVNEATVTSPDVIASNGVIHVIDKVLMPPADLQDIPTIAQGTGVHGALVSALTQANLVSTLQGSGPFTVFAPTDQAFTDAGIDLTAFTTDEQIATLADILTYHVVSGNVLSTDLTDGMQASAINGDKVSFTVNSEGVKVNDATVSSADVIASNGVIHVIDKVLMPPAGDICYNVISHTIIPGATKVQCNAHIYVENYSMGGQTITGCYNTITHAVSDISQLECNSYMWTPAVNLAVTAQATTIHTSLVAALTAAGLVDTISGETEYTVFAPSDQAFTDAGIDLDSFDTPEKIDTLKDILLYHVVAGTVMSTDLASGQSQVTAANGDSLDIDVSADGVSIGAEMATVVLADVPASNGVIHVIDKVLMPPADLPTCDYTVGIGLSGMAFNPSVVEVNVGQTVCWQWTDATMAHNVKEVDGDRSNVFVDGGVSSGTAQTTVDFRYTFTEDDSTFYYVCEPHILAEMYGKVIVGDGGVTVVDDSNTVDTDDESDSNTPGFVSVTAVIALMGALLFARNKNE